MERTYGVREPVHLQGRILPLSYVAHALTGIDRSPMRTTASACR